MPEKKTIEKSRRAKAKKEAPTTQAGPFVQEEIEHVREGKHGARSTKQAIAIGLSKARRAGVDLPPPRKGKTSAATRKKAERDYERGHGAPARRKASPKRSRATTGALKREGHAAGSRRALSNQARSAASRRSPSERSAAAKRAARTKGPAARSAAAKKVPARARRTPAGHADGQVCPAPRACGAKCAGRNRTCVRQIECPLVGFPRNTFECRGGRRRCVYGTPFAIAAGRFDMACGLRRLADPAAAWPGLLGSLRRRPEMTHSRLLTKRCLAIGALAFGSSLAATASAADPPTAFDNSNGPAPFAVRDLPSTEKVSVVNRPLLLTGAVVLAGTYGTSIGFAYYSDRNEDQKYLYYPLAGPWLDLDHRDCNARPCSNENLNKGLLIADGIGQGLGLVAIVTSFFLPERKTKRWYMIGDGKSVLGGPMRVGTGYGLGALGRF